MIGASTALSISDIPFEGPIAGVIVGRVDGKFVINPTVEQMEKSDMHLVVAGTKDAINMVEAGCSEVPEKVVLEGILYGHKTIRKLVEFQEQIVQAVGKEKMEPELARVDGELESRVRDLATDRIIEAAQVVEKQARQEALDAIRDDVLESLAEVYPEPEQQKEIEKVL